MITLNNTVIGNDSVIFDFIINNRRQFNDIQLLYKFSNNGFSSESKRITEFNNNTFSLTIQLREEPLSEKSKIEIAFSKDNENGILGSWTYNKTGFEADKYIAAYPNRMIGLSLTNNCNLKCSMCWQRDKSAIHYLPVDSIKKIVDSISIFGRPPIYLWGGEPLLHPNIWEIIQYLKSKNFFTIINTNGYLLGDNIKDILDNKVDMLIISIDGLEETHNTVRGNNKAFSKLISAIKELQKTKTRRPILTINCVINESNYNKLTDLVALKKELKAEYLEFQFMMFFSEKEKDGYKQMLNKLFDAKSTSVDYYPENQDKTDMNVLLSQINTIKKENDPNIRFFPYPVNSDEKVRDYYSNPNRIGINKCKNIENSLWVESNGDIVPCSCFPDYTIGNINQQSVFDIWNNQKFLDFRKKLDTALFPICQRCCDLYKTDFFQSK